MIIVRDGYSPKLKEMIESYNVEEFIIDNRTINSGEFTNQELQQLKVATLINKIDNKEELRELYKKLSMNMKIINPLTFYETKKKIPKQYSKEIVKSLTSIDELIRRGKSKEEGIYYEKLEDGTEIINLNGADFRMIVHYFIGAGAGSILEGENLSIGNRDKLWKYLENGTSTISGSFEGKTTVSHLSSIGICFTEFPEEQIINLCSNDAHTTHDIAELNPKEMGQYRYADEFYKMNEDDQSNSYSEVAMLRYLVNLDSIKNNTFSGRIMPSYVTVYYNEKEDDTEIAKVLAKRFEVDGKPIPIVRINEKIYDEIRKEFYDEKNKKINKVEQEFWK